jgi:hypothetical protein
MHILDDKNGRRRPLELAHQNHSEQVRLGITHADSFERAADDPGDIKKRTQRPRREQRIATAPKDARLPLLVTEPAHKRRLPDPSLALDQHKPAAAARDNRFNRIGQRSHLV